ncbi:MAG: hypothetical protein Q7J16_03330 [Candidatus Cloacimonadales bacterium]|nr:hypothetical protein [Candidatus Cloacimonadales bacterium]
MKFWILLVATLLLLISCFVPARKVYQFEANHQDKIWQQGRELVKLEDDSIRIVVSYDYSLHGVAWFDLAISNNSNETFVIDPIQFYCVFTNKFQEEITNNALDPEVMLFESDKQIEHYHADNLSRMQTNLLFSFFDVVEDISDRNKTEEERQQDEIERELRNIDAEKHQQSNLTRIDRINSDRNFIENNALRKTTLFPGQQIGGKLFFELVYDIKNVILYFPVGNRKFELEYKSIKY